MDVVAHISPRGAEVRAPLIETKNGRSALQECKRQGTGRLKEGHTSTLWRLDLADGKR